MGVGLRLVTGAVLLACGACIADETVVCGDGRRCPADTACITVGDQPSCASAQQQSECVGVVDGTPCTAVALGVCAHELCLPQVCGDGFIVGDEVCDDRNQLSGDGCSADCRSDETCDNGVGDLGEQCDDGNSASRDGCSSLCEIEALRWSPAAPTLPSPRSSGRLAYDESNHELVFVGGRDVDDRPLGDTWTFADGIWRRHDLVGGPAAGALIGLVYDSARMELVALDQNGTTWRWAGDTWVARSQIAPNHALATGGIGFDPVRQVIVAAVTRRNGDHDTWEWDGVKWSAVATAGPYLTDLAWDASEQVLLGHSYELLYEWNGAAWTAVPESGPLANNAAQLLSSGPLNVTLRDYAGHLLRWQNHQWTSFDVPLSTHYSGGAAFDDDSGQLVYLGGFSNDSSALTDEMQVVDIATRVSSAITPPTAPTGIVLLATLPASGTVMAIEVAPESRIKLWDGAWHDSPIAAPPTDGTALFVGTSNGAVLYREHSGDGALPAATFLLHDDVWTELSTESPTVGDASAAAYDALRDRVVLFGGHLGNADTGETWELDGDDWVQYMGPGPAPRAQAAMAYDVALHRTVLFGGYGSDLFDDTWSWDGSAWTQLPSQVPSPPPRRDAHLVYDPDRGRIQLIGGTAGQDMLRDEWELVGDHWVQLESADEPDFYVSLDPISWDPVRHQLLTIDAQVFARHYGVVLDRCTDVDTDGDGKIGCADDDCEARCEPLCPAFASCTDTDPHCGDGTCNTALEDARLCPEDCTP